MDHCSCDGAYECVWMTGDPQQLGTQSIDEVIHSGHNALQVAFNGFTVGALILFFFFLLHRYRDTGGVKLLYNSDWLNLDKLPGKRNCATVLPKAVDRGSIFPALQQLPWKWDLERGLGISHFVMFIVCSFIFPCAQVNGNGTSTAKITRELLVKNEKWACLFSCSWYN